MANDGSGFGITGVEVIEVLFGEIVHGGSPWVGMINRMFVHADLILLTGRRGCLSAL